MTKQQLPYKQYGLWYYPVLPSGMRLATELDFVTPLGDVKTGVDFLVASDVSPDYEAHRIIDCDGFERWREYVAAGKIYVKDAA
ncbi:MAG: hypothetical protein ACOYN4_05305 [Bacteroidales bacterium]